VAAPPLCGAKLPKKRPQPILWRSARRLLKLKHASLRFSIWDYK